MAETDILIDTLHPEDRDIWETMWQDSVSEHGQVERQAVEQTWTFLMERIPLGVNGLCARMDGQMVGFLHYVLHPVAGAVHPVCYMQDVYVAPEHRRKGVASHLIAALSHFCDQQGWERIYWLVDARNEGAQKLYQNIGIRLNFSLHAIPGKLIKEQAA